MGNSFSPAFIHLARAYLYHSVHSVHICGPVCTFGYVELLVYKMIERAPFHFAYECAVAGEDITPLKQQKSFG